MHQVALCSILILAERLIFISWNLTGPRHVGTDRRRNADRDEIWPAAATPSSTVSPP
jgi:hypothetical protein